jgi:hypothetical protein
LHREQETVLKTDQHANVDHGPAEPGCPALYLKLSLLDYCRVPAQDRGISATADPKWHQRLGKLDAPCQ